MNLSEIKQLDAEHFLGVFGERCPVCFVRGEGCTLYDQDGRAYTDLFAGIAVNALGYNHPAVTDALITQAQTGILHTSNLYYVEPQAKLAALLCANTFADRVFFANSGAEANEGGIKAARKYAVEKKGADHFTIVTLKNSFHGRTITTLSATGQEHYHELFQPLTPGFVHAPANDLEAVKEAALANKAAAVMIECIQGEGGVIALEQDFVQGLADFCAAEDILLLVDEVQTGNGRTGALYAYMNYGVTPDIVSTAKGLGGGLPLGATLLGEKVEFVLGAGDHGSTFGGNPVSCAGALSILGRIDDKLLQEVREKGDYVRGELSAAPGVESVSGMGLMIGVKPVKPAGDVVAACLEQGVLCLTAKDKVRLLPALNIPMETLKQAVAVLKAACAEG